MFDINKKIQIGNLKLDFPYFLAPMAGVTDYAFRVIAKEFGAGVVYSEFVSAHGIIRENEKTLNNMLNIVLFCLRRTVFLYVYKIFKSNHFFKN